MIAKIVASQSTLEVSVVVTMSLDEFSDVRTALRTSETASEARLATMKALSAGHPLPGDEKYLETVEADVQRVHDVRVLFERATTHAMRDEVEVIA